MAHKRYLGPSKTSWKKVLYIDQGYPDNYTDKLFLFELKHNVELKRISLKHAVLGAANVTEEFCTVTLFISIYIFIYNEWMSPEIIFNGFTCLTIIGYILYRLMDNIQLRQKLSADVQTLLIFLVFGQLFAPILHTLTDTISTDTIYTTSFLMLLIHLIFFDYNAPVAIVSNSLSLSAAVFASICLASRLASPRQAFVFITIAIEMFVLFPLLRKILKRPAIVSILLIIINYLAFDSYSSLMTITFCCFIVFLNIICPILYIKYQSYKDNIYGPWDEAIVQDADNINDLLAKKKV